jgi:hypothetical protein
MPPKRAQIISKNGTISVSADNSSLNQILRQIATDTGMKITGGVADERVFGHYGPAPADQVLSALLDGTSSNMVFVHRDGAPPELILTPRQGGPTPPNPNAAAFDDRSDPDAVSQVPQSERPAPPVAPVPQPFTPAGSDGSPAGTTTANPSQPESPNGVKTPQQIYEQLQRMRQQQQQPAQPQ